MIDYRLDELGWFEFEQLIQALLKERLGLGIEAWGGGGDWGRDAYFSGTLNYPTQQPITGIFVFQCKFVDAANAAGAKPRTLILNAVRKECDNIRKNLIPEGKWKQRPSVYGLFTNSPVSAKTHQEIEKLLGEAIPECVVNIQNGNNVCQWLRRTPEIVRSFPQLLSLRDLQDLLRQAVQAETINRSENAISLARAYSEVFVPVQAYSKAREKLTLHHFVVLEGPPEMGKTTIGRIIALSQVFSGWEAIECRNPAEVLRSFRRDRRQVFVADDFFGRTEYEPNRVSEWQGELVHILPMLDGTHWLILTCRAHLLEMAKSELDIADQNDRFPNLGEVIVDAGNLSQGEKARILYRHAKSAKLTPEAKTLVKRHAREIVTDIHFTPERIRRLVGQLIPELAAQQTVSETVTREKLAESLSNPTKQMRVSFRKLPRAHRWLLYSLLDSDGYDNTLPGSLQSHYQALCPSRDQIPYNKVLEELTEAFIRKTNFVFGKSIGWIHPSCRDLAIEELSENTVERIRFLRNCSENGLSLSCSVGGGSTGARDLPLLITDADWRAFSLRGKTLLARHPRLLSLVWFNFRSLEKKARDQPELQERTARFHEMMQTHILPIAAEVLGEMGFQHADDVDIYFTVCRYFKVPACINLEQAFAECTDEALQWRESNWVIWQDEQLPKRVFKFLEIIEKWQPQIMSEPVGLDRVNQVTRPLLERGRSESRSVYGLPDSDDEREEIASGFESLSKAFLELGTLAIIGETTCMEFDKLSKLFASEASTLREDLPTEPDSDGEGHSSSGSGEIDIGELFKDL